MADMQLSPHDSYLFHAGSYYQSYNIFGAHLTSHEGVDGALFHVWAPHAAEVRVAGDFNCWNGEGHRMKRIDEEGIWSLFIPGLRQWDMYKYEIITGKGEVLMKADPYGFYSELRPGTASKLVSLEGYQWGDREWLERKTKKPVYESPVNIYEVHAGSWKRKWDGSFLSYGELAEELIDYACYMGYTHIELLPLSEHPFDGSWGYQATGYYSITSRYGSPLDFMGFVDKCHQRGIGVIMDWVPGHFCKDAHGLWRFDGEPLYEYEDPMRGENHGWGTANFDLGKPEVVSYLISNAIFWLDIYHIDGIRMDAVASMLYLDYDRKSGEWKPNKNGGRENLEAVEFIKNLSRTVFEYFPHTLMIAEESTTWPLVTAPTYAGGLGFNYKWNMGWMNDMLRYMELDPVHRKWHHNLITFSFMYTYSENYVLPLSHDEVVHGKKSLIDKMHGSYEQKFASLRAFYGYMMAHPGKKLLFMGGEFAQFIEWRHDYALDWLLLEFDLHRKMQQYVRCLNDFYIRHPALWELDHSPEGFQWIDPNNSAQSIIVFMRSSREPGDTLIVLCNFTPVAYGSFRIGVPREGEYREVFNSDREEFGGSGCCMGEALISEKRPWHNQPFSLELRVPPLAAVFLRLERLRKSAEAGAEPLRLPEAEA